MVEKAAGGQNSTSTLDAFGGRLITAIDSGIYASQKSGWVACSDIGTAAACALEWYALLSSPLPPHNPAPLVMVTNIRVPKNRAQDANAINCAYVLKTNETNQELDGAYYTGAQPYVEEQIAKGGYRLASWVNAIAAAA